MEPNLDNVKHISAKVEQGTSKSKKNVAKSFKEVKSVDSDLSTGEEALDNECTTIFERRQESIVERVDTLDGQIEPERDRADSMRYGDVEENAETKCGTVGAPERGGACRPADWGETFGPAGNPDRKLRRMKISLTNKEVEFAECPRHATASEMEVGQESELGTGMNLDALGDGYLVEDVLEQRRSQSVTTLDPEDDIERPESEEGGVVDPDSDADPKNSARDEDLLAGGESSLDAMRKLFDAEELKAANTVDVLNDLRKKLAEIVSIFEYDTLVQARNRYHNRHTSNNKDSELDQTVTDLPLSVINPSSGSDSADEENPSRTSLSENGATLMKHILDVETQFHQELVSLNDLGAKVERLNVTAVEWSSPGYNQALDLITLEDSDS